MSDGTQVALVNMPFSYAKYPSIQLGTLSALLKSNGIPVDCHHLNVRFAHLIGVELHESICEKRAVSGCSPLFCSKTTRSGQSTHRSLSRFLSRRRKSVVSRLAISKKWLRVLLLSF